MPAKKSKIAAAWAIFHQIISHSTEKLIPVMTHPGGEQYECFTVAQYDNNDDNKHLHSVVSINLNGTGIFVKDIILQYGEQMTTEQIEKLVLKIIAAAGLRLRREGPRKLPPMEFIGDLLESKKNTGFRMINVWYDGSYHGNLSDEAKAFNNYPVPIEHHWLEHIPWWIITKNNRPLAVCNLETNLLVLDNGNQYDLATGKQNAFEAISLKALKQEFNEVIEETKQLLIQNAEWEKRYISYAKEILDNIEYIDMVRKSFREWDPLFFYLNITKAKNAKKSLRLELRYLGQTVAELIYKKELKLDTADYNENNAKYFGCPISLSKVPWDSPKAASFRQFFKKRDVLCTPGGDKKNEEHRLESSFLDEFSKTANKLLPFIQPVRVAKIRFPMPTPLRASKHKKIAYANHSGGGIDIFARAGKGGKATKLCILELKDENKPKEPPKDAVKQALAYAVFIRELLRSNAGQAWWKLFGFNGKIPKKLAIVAACLMPTNENDDYSFAGMELAIDKDIIQLHYLYFTEEQKVITGIKTSMNLEKHYGKNSGGKV